MRLINRVALTPILLLLASQVAFAQFQFRRSGGAVNDFAGKLSATTRQRLEAAVIQFQRRSGIDLRVVTIPKSDLRGRPIEAYSMGLVNHWAVGRGSGGRGLLLLVAIDPPDKAGIYHGATRLEVSRSLERDIPNQLASEVTRKMRDSLTAGWFDEAVTIGVDGVVSSIDQKQRGTSESSVGGYAPPPAAPSRSQGVPAGGFSTSGGGTAMFGFILFLLFLAVPAMIIAAIVRGIARGAGGGSLARGRPWTRRTGGIGVGTGIGLSGTDWSNQDWTSNSASMDSSSTNWSDSSSSSISDSSSSSSFSDSSSSSFSDSSSSSSSGGDFGGGGSTDSW